MGGLAAIGSLIALFLYIDKRLRTPSVKNGHVAIEDDETDGITLVVSELSSKHDWFHR